MTETAADEARVTRVELLQAIELAFSHARAPRDALISSALAAGARPAVLDTIRSLPDRTIHGPRELWAHLPDLPVR